MAMSPGDAADLGRCRRGVEPLRIVIMPQHDRQVASPVDRADAGSSSDGAVVPEVAHRHHALSRPRPTTALVRWPHRSDLFTNPPR